MAEDCHPFICHSNPYACHSEQSEESLSSTLSVNSAKNLLVALFVTFGVQSQA
tara:strand:- start:4124 stop:4282 length:159 start_codon:yes stop_codon:yes gene_type:complete